MEWWVFVGGDGHYRLIYPHGQEGGDEIPKNGYQLDEEERD